MNHAKMDVLRFDGDDLIATSGILTYTISGLGDCNYCTFLFRSSDGTINYTSARALRDSGKGIVSGTFQAGGVSCALTTIVSDQCEAEQNEDGYFDTTDNAIYNGVYVWDAGLGVYLKQ